MRTRKVRSPSSSMRPPTCAAKAEARRSSRGGTYCVAAFSVVSTTKRPESPPASAASASGWVAHSTSARLSAGISRTRSPLPPAGSTLHLVQVTASHYGADVTYQLDGAPSAVALNAPLLLQGTWADGLSGDFGSVAFANASGEEVTVQVLIGYDVA